MPPKKDGQIEVDEETEEARRRFEIRAYLDPVNRQESDGPGCSGEQLEDMLIEFLRGLLQGLSVPGVLALK